MLLPVQRAKCLIFETRFIFWFFTVVTLRYSLRRQQRI
ncbi:hypothetical protein PAMC26510_14770 [Caballeronia sordidicola]|uniref:Uncharacterized protein n=1 Tax=Caballeronia sordidicola TaxID=196367 RepID=A0A242MUT5_CABSO|nr:hypothetical protein PAMC26510_14770 [Caballeronia sordidicola]